MSKALEALKEIGEIYQHTEEGGYRLYDADKIKNCAKEQFELLLKALTPPTEQEVCEALGKTFEINVKYEKETKTFKFVCGGNIIYPSAYENQKNKIVINSMAIPPHLITLIGRFYQSLKGE